MKTGGGGLNKHSKLAIEKQLLLIILCSDEKNNDVLSLQKNTLKLFRIILKAFSKTPDFLRPGSGTSFQPVALAPSELGPATDAGHHREETQRFEPMNVRRKWFLIQPSGAQDA